MSTTEAAPQGAENSAPPRAAYTPREVSERLGISYRAVLRLISGGELRARRVSAQRLVVPVDAVTEYLAAS